MPVTNIGRLIQFLPGIQGVTPGGNATVSLPVNRRYHRIKLQVTAISFTGGTALAAVTLTGSGSGATITPTIGSNGAVASVAVVGGGSGYVTGDTISFVDATGSGFVGTVTAAAGAITAVAVTVAGVAVAVDPSRVITALTEYVNGVAVRDISPRMILTERQAQNVYPLVGELPLIYSDPKVGLAGRPSEENAFDMFGQGTFDLALTIASTGASSISIVGVMEFDSIQNLADNKPFVMPLIQHVQTFPVGVWPSK